MKKLLAMLLCFFMTFINTVPIYSIESEENIKAYDYITLYLDYLTNDELISLKKEVDDRIKNIDSKSYTKEEQFAIDFLCEYVKHLIDPHSFELYGINVSIKENYIGHECVYDVYYKVGASNKDGDTIVINYNTILTEDNGQTWQEQLKTYSDIDFNLAYHEIPIDYDYGYYGTLDVNKIQEAVIKKYDNS